MLPEGARLLQPPPVCANCGSPGMIDAPLYELPPQLNTPGVFCQDCTATVAVSILGGSGSRAQRRRQEFSRKHKPSHTRKRKRRKR